MKRFGDGLKSAGARFPRRKPATICENKGDPKAKIWRTNP
jgi:hypothetical protein